MDYTRREFGKLALAGLPAAAFLEIPLIGSALAQTKPNSKFGGVQIGVITYSYRSMPDQSGEATLRYVMESGISSIELMDGPAEQFAGRPAAPARGGGAGAPGAAGGGGRGGGRAAGAPGAPAAGAPAAAAGGGLPGGGLGGLLPCEPGRGRAAGAAGGGGGRGGAGGGRGAAAPPTPEQQAAQAAQQAFNTELRKWRTSVSMDKFKQLRKMYNDAGVTIYAYKPDGMQKNMQTTNEEFDYVFNVASVLGASHLTMELPGGADAAAMMKRMSEFGAKHKVAVAYHTHGQGSMTAFDEALAMSKWNMINVDLGHYVAAGNVGGSPIAFLEKHHARISSFHLKDRTMPERCSLTVPFGTGDGQLEGILRTVKRNKWTFPATIELEYPIPQGSNAVAETKKCVDYARGILA